MRKAKILLHYKPNDPFTWLSQDYIKVPKMPCDFKTKEIKGDINRYPPKFQNHQGTPQKET